jgi:hypothetical protein
MRKLRFLSMSMLVLLIQNICFAQNKKDDNFPTYEQIRGNKAETVDYVSQGGGSWFVVKREVTAASYFGAFSYPAETSVYYLNGKKVKDKKQAEKEIEEKSLNVENVSIGPVERDGKRVIRIDYVPKEN